MANTLVIWGQGSTTLNAIDLPEPINPFYRYNTIRSQTTGEIQNALYKRLGDRVYRLFVTNQALREVSCKYVEARRLL